MALSIAYEPGQTPLDPDESAQLIPTHLTTQGDLDEWEQTNILEARGWLDGQLRRRRPPDVLSEGFSRTLHRRMFDQTWQWAGQFRTSDKNIGCPWQQVPMRLRQLLDNTAFQLSIEPPLPLDDMAARFHHALVLVHPFPNGNGRHARLMTDALLRARRAEPFSWGSRNLVGVGEARTRYIQALRAADQGDFEPLRVFVRS
jgi:Fic-DOC domain mobile mystery protein B